jgi:hypothetical protein
LIKARFPTSEKHGRWAQDIHYSENYQDSKLEISDLTTSSNWKSYSLTIDIGYIRLFGRPGIDVFFSSQPIYSTAKFAPTTSVRPNPLIANCNFLNGLKKTASQTY